MSQALLSFGTGLLTVACSPIQKTVVVIASFQEYSPSPVPRPFFPLKAEPASFPASLLFVGNIVTLGWIRTSALSGNFMAYRAKSVLPWDEAWANAVAPEPARRPRYKTTRKVDLVERMRSKLTHSPALSKSFSFISCREFGKKEVCLRQ